ncbi:Ribonuclease E [Aquimixticola soesokkakensis]|uniref:Ribonuclease E n=1 Tax=Aquimixticola soesokkakensis TaxID=1519096 RepID=A0A1Y5SR65_9RHOB|nr:ribonuclease E/G [Aquimixticola soesokkakensis]SLN46545.1 Ribonuclease E [Aquimixticola soesokkakensis]
MAKKMLIDATHAEETRVVVVDGNKVEEFDFESENKRQLAGNIYLAKVTRVEPSLQAAFVDYGGNRHGFLAFSEIHPDYYQIPQADRQALMDEELAYAKQLAEEEDKPKKSSRSRSRSRSKTKAEETKTEDAVHTAELSGDASDETVREASDEAVREGSIPGMDVVDLGPDPDADASDATAQEVTAQEDASAGEAAPSDAPQAAADNGDSAQEDGADADTADDESGDDESDDDAQEDDGDSDIESVADDDTQEDIRPVRKPRARRYKIQEVIKVRQILLVQVVKEERGNKGAALTTYLSLAGRYCVLMPNTARGGGISRKITNAADRKKLKDIANELEVPQGAGLIIRTAGSQRTKTEIKRDYDYLKRMWEQIRELTLKSVAPAKIYEEGDLIKRSIRDLYNKDIDEVFVEGVEGYRTAKDFMKMIMPSHAKNVKLYNDGLPLFARYQVEGYLSSMFNPTVQLKSGGYIVIDVTEALVAVDVNSGRATKEGSIEDTATKTNLEAAEEVARQARLRDLAGLIVIDFIDMEERKNNAAVEKRLKDKLKTDRARIQVGRISGFGLMEMSRQRLRPGMLEATTMPCHHCHGTGLIRSDDNMALTILRQLEEEGTRKRSKEVLLRAPIAIVNFLMNQKRERIAQIEARYGMAVRVECDPAMISPDFTIEKFKSATRDITEVVAPVVTADLSYMDDDDDYVEEAEEVTETAPQTTSDSAPASSETAVQGEEGEGEPKPKKRRRRRRRRKSSSSEGHEGDTSAESLDAEGTGASQGDEAEGAQGSDSDEGGDKPKRTVSRSSRSRSSSKPAEPAQDTAPEASGADSNEVVADAPVADTPAADTPGAEVPVEEAAEAATTDTPPASKSTRTRASRSRSSKAKTAEAAEPVAAETSAEVATDVSGETPAAPVSETVAAPALETPVEAVVAQTTVADTAAQNDIATAEPVVVVEAAPAPQAEPQEVAQNSVEDASADAPVDVQPEVQAAPETAVQPDKEVESATAGGSEETEDPAPKKRGWWSMR